MRKTILSFMFAFFLATFGFAQEAGTIYLEVTPGYSFAIGDGYSWIKYGRQYKTGTYTEKKTQSLGPQGFVGGIRAGYGVLDHLMLMIGVDYAFGTHKWESATSWYGDGSVLYEDSIEKPWSSLTINSGIRLYSKTFGRSMMFFGGAGALFFIPFESTTTITSNDPFWDGYEWEYTYNYDFGVGAYGEIGFEYRFTEAFGVNLTVLGTLLEITRNEREYKVYQDGNNTFTSTTKYEDDAETDGNNQTESDVTTLLPIMSTILVQNILSPFPVL
jgi:hypothetical protein